MGDYQQSITVSAEPDRVFMFLADVGNLPRYFEQMRQAEEVSEEEVHTTAEVDGQVREGDAWFRTDPGARTISWGSESDSDYSGDIRVEEDAAGSVVTVRLHTERTDDDRIDDALVESLDNIKDLVES